MIDEYPVLQAQLNSIMTFFRLGILAAATYHEYLELTNVTVLDPATLDASGANAAAVVAAVRAVNATLPVWAGELAALTAAGEGLGGARSR